MLPAGGSTKSSERECICKGMSQPRGKGEEGGKGNAHGLGVEGVEGFEGKIILQGHFGLQYFLIFAFMARVCDSSEMMSFISKFCE